METVKKFPENMGICYLVTQNQVLGVRPLKEEILHVSIGEQVLNGSFVRNLV